MTKMTSLDRILLLITGLLASYQVTVGIDHFATLPVIAYTFAFGALLIAGLLLIILGFEVLGSPVVIIVSTIIPLSLSLGLVGQYLASWQNSYLIFTILGFLAVVVTRTIQMKSKFPILVLAVVHGIAGLMISLLPISLVIQGTNKPAFVLVGVGGMLMGIGGLLLSFLKAGKPVLSRATIHKIFPGLLLVMTTCFVTGFLLG